MENAFSCNGITTYPRRGKD